MANNGRGENEIKKETVGWVSNPPTTPLGVDSKNISGSLKEENQSAVTERIDDKNISGSLKEENQPAVGWVSNPPTTPLGVDNKDISGSLKDNHTTTQSTPNGVAVGKNAHPITEENNLSGSLKENPTLDLPELNADNWHIIVQKLTPELGTNVLLAQHTSLIKVENQEITLSVHKNGELFRKPAHLTALGEVLSHHYGTQKNIQLIEWQDNFENATQAKQRHKEAEQQQRLNELHLDPFAQKLQKTFGGEWVVK